MNAEQYDINLLTIIENFPTYKLKIDELIHGNRRLQVYDLAVKPSMGTKKWATGVRLELINVVKLLQPDLLKAFFVTLASHPKETLLYRLEKIYELKLSAFEGNLIHNACDFIFKYSTNFLQKLEKMTDREVKRRYLFKYFNLFRKFKRSFTTRSVPNYIFFFQNLKQFENILYCDFRRDSDLVLTYVKSMCRSDMLKKHMFYSSRLNFLLQNCGTFDFWGLKTNTGALSREFDPVMTCFVEERYKSVPLLVEFGFSYRFLKESYEELCYQFRKIRYHGRSIVNPRCYSGLKETWKDKRKTLAMLALLAYDSEEPTLALRTFAFLSLAIPEPYLTPLELQRTVRDSLRSGFRGELHRICQQYRWGKVHVEEYEDYVPRSLLHLSRCAVRGHLAQNARLPEGVAELPLPQRIKSYLTALTSNL